MKTNEPGLIHRITFLSTDRIFIDDDIADVTYYTTWGDILTNILANLDRVITFDNSDLVAGIFAWNHGMNTEDYIIQVKDENNEVFGGRIKTIDVDNLIVDCGGSIYGTYTITCHFII
jgi:hypothetical protein